MIGLGLPNQRKKERKATNAYTPHFHPTTPYLLIPALISRSLHPTITPSTQCDKNLCSIRLPKYSSPSRIHSRLITEWAILSVHPEPWRFTNNSLGPPHAQSFSVCLSSWVYVVCVCFLLYLSVYLCFARCVFIVLCIFFSPFLISKHISIWMSLYKPHCSYDSICSINMFKNNV